MTTLTNDPRTPTAGMTTSNAASLAVSSVLLLGAFTGTSSAPPLLNAGAQAQVLAKARVGHGLPGPMPRSVIAGTLGATSSVGSYSATSGVHEVAVPMDDAGLVSWLKVESGLTWEGLGAVFGVSRRAVHLWANGGRLNESNAATLRRFAAEIRALDLSSPEDVRAAITEVDDTGTSLLDRFRRDIGRAPRGAMARPETLLGAGGA